MPAFAVEHAELGKLAILELRLPRRPGQRVAGELARPPVRGQQLKQQWEELRNLFVNSLERLQSFVIRGFHI